MLAEAMIETKGKKLVMTGAASSVVGPVPSQEDDFVYADPL
jgi:hypothetical protein